MTPPTFEPVPLGILWTLAQRLAARNSWPAGLVERVGLALVDTDPDGLDALASDPDWYKAAAEALATVPTNAGESALVEPLLKVARQGASGARPMTLLEQVADVRQGVADDLGAIAEGAAKAAEVPREVARAAGELADTVAESPKTAAGLGLVLAGLLGLAAWRLR